MSNSDDHLFLLQHNKDQIQFNLIPFSDLQFHDALHLPTIKDPTTDQEFEEDDEFDQDRIILRLHPEEAISNNESVKSSAQESKTQASLGELKDNDDDGFKTPDSSDRKIPEVKQCPPAPRKAKAIKRKAPVGNNVRRNLLLDLSKEIESLFPRSILVDFNRKMKKARTG